MGRSLKIGPPPVKIWAIKNEYEIRYYTTKETLAQAVAYGYDGAIVEYIISEGPVQKTVEDALKSAGAEPKYPLPNPRNWLAPLSAAEQALINKYEKEVKAWRKKRRDAVKAVLNA